MGIDWRLTIGDSVRLGALLGVAFGAWNLAASWRDPLADDSVGALLTFYGPMFAAWGVAGFVATRRSGRIREGLKVGATVAFATFVVFALANLLRVNLFLDAIRDRADWRNVIERFHASGANSLRSFVNYDFVTGMPFKVLVASAIGAVTGSVGGLVAIVGRRALSAVSVSE